MGKTGKSTIEGKTEKSTMEGKTEKSMVEGKSEKSVIEGKHRQATINDAPELVNEEWYHGYLPREEINKIVRQEGHYLVRTTKAGKNQVCFLEFLITQHLSNEKN